MEEQPLPVRASSLSSPELESRKGQRGRIQGRDSTAHSQLSVLGRAAKCFPPNCSAESQIYRQAISTIRNVVVEFYRQLKIYRRRTVLSCQRLSLGNASQQAV